MPISFDRHFRIVEIPWSTRMFTLESFHTQTLDIGPFGGTVSLVLFCGYLQSNLKLEIQTIRYSILLIQNFSIDFCNLNSQGGFSNAGGQTYNLPNGQTLSLTYNNGASFNPFNRPSTSQGSSIAFGGQIRLQYVRALYRNTNQQIFHRNTLKILYKLNSQLEQIDKK